MDYLLNINLQREQIQVEPIGEAQPNAQAPTTTVGDFSA